MIPSRSYLQPVADSFEYITNQPLDILGLLAQAHHPKAGAVVLFSGDVRDTNSGKEVVCLEYEAHFTMASKLIEDILQEATGKWQLHRAIAQHRIGKLDIGESAVVVITASPHRKEAYAANRFIIDKIKHEAPIWKCEYFTDGTRQWGANCNCHQVTGSAEKHSYES